MRIQSLVKCFCNFKKEGNYRWMVYILVSGLLMPLVVGCVSMKSVFSHELHEIAKMDARKAYPSAILMDHHKKISFEQSRSINELYGDEISQEGDLIAYYDALERNPRRYIAKVFLVHAKSEMGQWDVIVGMRGRVADRIVVKNNIIREGKPVIPNEFLKQFIGRSLQDSWHVAEGPQDVVTLPSMIRPVAGNLRASKEMASNIRKVLVWITALEIYYS